jgi:hypothetical protein
MQNEKWRVAKVKGIDPEQFFVFLTKEDESKASLRRASGFFSEEGLRAELTRRGRTEEEINNLIERARSNPVMRPRLARSSHA